jgi:predicted dehydrogenase
VLGEPIVAVCAQLGSLHGGAGEDHSGVLLRFVGGAIGAMVASQVSPGSKNGLAIQFDGSEGSLRWEQEAPEDLWLGRARGPIERHRKTPDELTGDAGPLAHLPAGHLEGYNSTFANLFRAAYRRILGTPLPGDEQIATIAEGLELVRLIDAVRRSADHRAWIEIPPAPAA